MNNIPLNKIPSQLPVANRLNNTATKQTAGIPFSEILKERQAAVRSEELKFSKHANERLASRNIDLSDDQYRRLETGAKMAFEKGIKESLVMVDNLAFIVNVKNNTVITAVNEGEEKIFTNIDGAVII
jgi:flagellar operon protein